MLRTYVTKTELLKNKPVKIIQYLIFSLFIISCHSKPNDSSNLYLKRDKGTSMYAYFDKNGNKILGDFYAAYTDTISDYGIVADPNFVLIDKKGNHIYNIYAFDNGPDYTSEGTYRIIKDGKIGYVDSLTSKTLIEPKYKCAFPFENGKAKVSFNCEIIIASPDDEHKVWKSKDWFYIDKSGKKIE